MEIHESDSNPVGRRPPVYLIWNWGVVDYDGAWKPRLWRAKFTDGDSVQIERFYSGRHVLTADGQYCGWSNTLAGAQRKAAELSGGGAFRRLG